MFNGISFPRRILDHSEISEELRNDREVMNAIAKSDTKNNLVLMERGLIEQQHNNRQEEEEGAS